jgi:hypothetical protein
MRNKNKENRKVPKSAKTRLSDLTPKKDASGGAIPENFPKAYDRKPKAASSIRRSVV